MENSAIQILKYYENVMFVCELHCFLPFVSKPDDSSGKTVNTPQNTNCQKKKTLQTDLQCFLREFTVSLSKASDVCLTLLEKNVSFRFYQYFAPPKTGKSPPH
jgi:hypothetical protein